MYKFVVNIALDYTRKRHYIPDFSYQVLVKPDFHFFKIFQAEKGLKLTKTSIYKQEKTFNTAATKTEIAEVSESEKEQSMEQKIVLRTKTKMCILLACSRHNAI